MPVYNAEEFVKEAITSILGQTHKNFEFIIINDGSTDRSLEIIKNYLVKDKRIIIISRENRGLVSSLNEGFKNAKGKYIARMDADDISLPERFENQVRIMEDERLDICGGTYFRIRSSGERIKINSTPQTHDLCTLSLISKVPFAHSTVMIRKEFLEKHNLFYGQSDFKKAEDLDLWVRMHEKGAKFGNTSTPILNYRISNNSLSKINNKQIKRQTLKILENFKLKNQKIIETIINEKFKNLNDEEQSVIIRAIYRIYLVKFRFDKLYLMRKYNKKILIKSLLSEIKNTALF